jgi:ABC-2 type transport system ATP-binding protein
MVALALVLAAGPEVLILDDPALGLDAIARRTFLETMIKVIQGEGRTILFASHHLGDVERVADRVVVMEKGVLRVDCPTEEFLHRVRRVEFEVSSLPTGIEAFPGLLDVESKGGRARLTLVNLDDERRAQLKLLAPDGFDEVPLNLEDAFIAYTGSRPLRSAAPTKGD